MGVILKVPEVGVSLHGRQVNVHLIAARIVHRSQTRGDKVVFAVPICGEVTMDPGGERMQEPVSHRARMTLAKDACLRIHEPSRTHDARQRCVSSNP